MRAVFHHIDRPSKRLKVSAQIWSVAIFLILALALVGCGASSEPAPDPTPASQAQRPAAAPTETAVAAEATASLPEPTEPPAQPMARATEAPTEMPEPTAETQSEPTMAAEPEASAGAGFAIGEGSEATFTVNEKLAWLDLPNDAVMRTNGITGVIHVDGQATVIELDLHSMTSDQERRDGYVRNRMFPDDRTATFTVTDLGDLPEPLPEGEAIMRQVQGELTIKGVTKPITFDVEARRDPDKLFVLGRTTFTWADLELPPPNIPGRIEVRDEVRVEVLLSAVPGG